MSPPLPIHPLISRILASDQAGNRRDAAQAYIALGCLLHSRMERTGQAEQAFRHAVMRDPLAFAAHANLGTLALRRNHSQEAAHYLLAALSLAGRRLPALAGLAHDLNAALGDLAKEARSLPEGEPAGITGAMEECLLNLGKALTDLGYFAQARQCYTQAIVTAPDFALGHWNRALEFLRHGDFAEGWREYEWRWSWDHFPEPHRNLPLPRWHGEPVSRLAVWTEQGAGDAIQFAALLPRLASRTGIILEAAFSLVRLFHASFPGIKIVMRSKKPRWSADEADFECPLLSLPDLLHLRLDHLPAARNYLTPPAEARTLWEGRISPSQERAVGVVWAGRPEHHDDARRSMPPAALAPLAALPGIRWFSLQLGKAMARKQETGLPLIDLAPQIGDFADTAAVLERLDLVLTVDTAVAHLAGAMNRPAWLMLPFAADWRWGEAGETTPWYPSLRLFRQHRPGDWNGVIEDIRAAFPAWTAHRG